MINYIEKISSVTDVGYNTAILWMTGMIIAGVCALTAIVTNFLSGWKSKNVELEIEIKKLDKE